MNLFLASVMGIFCIPISSLVKTVLQFFKNAHLNVHKNVRLVNPSFIKSNFDGFGFKRYPDILKSAVGEDADAEGFGFDHFPLDMVAKSDTILTVNRNHRKTLAAVFADPVSGNIEWRRIEALFKAAGCEIIEGSGSRITIVHEGQKAAFHRPHPGKDACGTRYEQSVIF